MSWTPKQVSAPFLMDSSVKNLLKVFAEAGIGNEIRFVGGSVRNILMNLPMSDIDLATTLTPDEIKKLFAPTKYAVHDTGISHGTVTVVVDHEPYEITTLRRDVETDGRRAVIEFTKDWAEDAQRRDFRCNAIYMDSNGMLYDPTQGGIDDAMNRRLVFVGDAGQRICEDYLRVLRLFRFMATLNATCDQSAIDACTQHRAGINTLSGERIEKEIMKLLAAPTAYPAIKAMYDAQVYSEVFSVFNEAFETATQVTTDPVLRLVGMLVNFSTMQSGMNCLDRWKSSNELKSRTRAAAQGFINLDRDSLRLAAYQYGVQAMEDRAILTFIELKACGWHKITFAELMETVEDVKATMPKFSLRGADLIAAGFKPGRVIGETLKAVENWWVANGYPSVEECKEKMMEYKGD